MFMELSPSWKASSWPTTQQLPNTVGNPQQPSIGPQPEPYQSIPFHLIYDPFSIIHPNTSSSSYLSLPFWFCKQIPICISLLLIRSTCNTHLNLLQFIFMIIPSDVYIFWSCSLWSILNPNITPCLSRKMSSSGPSTQTASAYLSALMKENKFHSSESQTEPQPCIIKFLHFQITD
jgi:hypothetical protein